MATDKTSSASIKYIIGIGIVIVGVVVVYLLMRPVSTTHSSDEEEKVQCGSKVVYRYKYPSEFFPTTISSYSSSASLATSILDKIIANSDGSSSASVAIKDSAIQLREKLDQDNIFFENNLKAFFILSNDSPCDDSLRYIYASYITEMSDKIIQLKQFVQQVSVPSAATATSNIPVNKDSVLAVVDTAKKQVDTTSKNINPSNNNQLIVIKNVDKLNTAVSSLQTKYEKVNATKLNAALKYRNQ